MALAALPGLGVALVIVAILVIATFLVVLLNDLQVVFKSQGDELILELGTHIVVVIHKLTGVLLSAFTLLIVVLLGLLGLALSELLLVGHLDGLEEVEETFLVDSLGDGLAGLTLLCLLLLLDLLLGHVLAVLPLDLSAVALFDDVLSGHDEALLELSVLEVVVLLESEEEVEAVASCVELALNVLQMHEDGAILLLDQAGDATMVEHGAHPEPWDTEGGVLDVLDITGGDLNLLVVFVVEELSAGLILSEDISRGLLLTGEELVSLLIDLLVQAVILKLELTVDLLVLLIDLAFLVLNT